MPEPAGAAHPERWRVPEGDLTRLVARARALAAAGGRRLLGITGAPGAGKSTTAAALAAALAPEAVLVPMDGFHLAEAELHRLGRHHRKGALDTFDAAGYVCLLRRLREPEPGTVWAPRFDRGIEEAIAGAIPVEPLRPPGDHRGQLPARGLGSVGRGAGPARRGLVCAAARARAPGPTRPPGTRRTAGPRRWPRPGLGAPTSATPNWSRPPVTGPIW